MKIIRVLTVTHVDGTIDQFNSFDRIEFRTNQDHVYSIHIENDEIVRAYHNVEQIKSLHIDLLQMEF